MASRRKFTEEYKAEAVALVVNSDRSVTDVAHSLGIHETTLSNWVARAKERGDVPEKPLTVSERAELAPPTLRELKTRHTRIVSRALTGCRRGLTRTATAAGAELTESRLSDGKRR